MVAERAGYTVSMFVVDISRSMGTKVELKGKDGNAMRQTTHLMWSLEYVKYKIQEMIFAGRKTDKCGVIVFGSTETDNIISKGELGYENVSEYIPIDTPNAGTLAKLNQLEATNEEGDPIDALIVAIQTQDAFLGNKKTWTRKIAIVTNGHGAIEQEDWELTVDKINSLDIQLTVLGVNFDDESFPFTEANKQDIKAENEEFYRRLTSTIKHSIYGNLEYALQELAYPDVKLIKSSMMSHILRIGDAEEHPEESIEIPVKVSKSTMLARPKSLKKFAPRPSDRDEGQNGTTTYAQLSIRTEYYLNKHTTDLSEAEKVELKEEEEENIDAVELEMFEKEELVKGFKYGTTYVTCPDGHFENLPGANVGIHICGFFPESKFHREQAMGEISYIWADPHSPLQQVTISSIAQAMLKKGAMAIARWVTASGRDPKMGVLLPSFFEEVDCLVWVQMPFADDLRKYSFPSLQTLVNTKGDELKENPYLPTPTQSSAMDAFIDAMDLMDAGDKDEQGNRLPWFDPASSYNPAIHRIKQALFHCGIFSDLAKNPIGPPHAELVKYMETPKRVVKRARDPAAQLASVMHVKAVPKKVAKPRKDGHELSTSVQDEGVVFWDIAPESTVPTTLPSETRVEILKVTKSADADHHHGLHTPARSFSPNPTTRQALRLVKQAQPLSDFEDAIERGESQKQVLQDFGDTVIEIVTIPHASRRHDEMLLAMSRVRQVALKSDGGIRSWNKFIYSLHRTCSDKSENLQFWTEVKTSQTNIALISDSEAKQHHRTSSVSDATAATLLA